jgi:hypothetical protein
MGGDLGFWNLHDSMRRAANGYLCFRSAARFGFGRRAARLAIQCYLENPGYSGSPIAVHRSHAFKWIFPQEKATLHSACDCTRIGEPF